MAALRKQNLDYRGKIQVYRKIVADREHMELLIANEARQGSGWPSRSPNESKIVSPEKPGGQKMTLTKKIFQLEQELQEARTQGQFLNQVNPIKSIVKASSMKELLRGLTKAYKRTLNCKRVDFFFLN